MKAHLDAQLAAGLAPYGTDSEGKQNMIDTTAPAQPTTCRRAYDAHGEPVVIYTITGGYQVYRYADTTTARQTLIDGYTDRVLEQFDTVVELEAAARVALQAQFANPGKHWDAVAHDVDAIRDAARN